MNAPCLRCGQAVDRRNISGYCKPCFLTHLNKQPEQQAKRIASLRITLGKPEHQARFNSQRLAASRSRMAWCPDGYRAAYRTLTRIKQVPAAQARAMILEQYRADNVRAVLERQAAMHAKHLREVENRY